MSAKQQNVVKQQSAAAAADKPSSASSALSLLSSLSLAIKDAASGNLFVLHCSSNLTEPGTAVSWHYVQFRKKHALTVCFSHIPVNDV